MTRQLRGDSTKLLVSTRPPIVDLPRLRSAGRPNYVGVVRAQHAVARGTTLFQRWTRAETEVLPNRLEGIGAGACGSIASVRSIRSRLSPMWSAARSSAA